jgi:hypothetical protein
LPLSIALVLLFDDCAPRITMGTPHGCDENMPTCRLGMFLLIQMLLTYVLSGTSGFGILQVMFGHRSGLH